MTQQDNILQKILRRPAMYTGGNSLRSVCHFLSRYGFALDRHRVSSDNDPLILAREFHDWVAYRLHFYESTSGWCNMICDRTSTDQEAIGLFRQLLDDFQTRTPHTVAKLLAHKKTFQRSVGRSACVTCNYPESISLVTYTDDPGFFAYSDTSESFPSEGFHPDLKSFELRIGADRSMLTIIDNNWHPKPYAGA